MLLRNLNPKQGLCNGTRLLYTLLITSMTQRLIRTGVLTGRYRMKKCIRNSYSTGYGYTVSVKYSVSVQVWSKTIPSMTINKSQCQTLQRTGLASITRSLLCQRSTLYGIFSMWISPSIDGVGNPERLIDTVEEEFRRHIQPSSELTSPIITESILRYTHLTLCTG